MLKNRAGWRGERERTVAYPALYQDFAVAKPICLVEIVSFETTFRNYISAVRLAKHVVKFVAEVVDGLSERTVIEVAIPRLHRHFLRYVPRVGVVAIRSCK